MLNQVAQHKERLSKKQVICIGGAIIDKKAICDVIIPRTSNSVRFKQAHGGVARNVAENLARLQIPTSLLTFTGHDPDGKKILDYCTELGINTTFSEIIPNQNTGTYTAILDRKGELQFAFVDLEIFNVISWQLIERHWQNLNHSAYIFAETNLPVDSLKQLILRAQEDQIPVIIDPVSVEKAMKLPENLEGIYLLLPNRDEAETIARTNIGKDSDCRILAEKMHERGLKNVIITLGQQGIYYSDGKRDGFISPYRTTVRDVTGAGDALIAGTIYGLIKGNNLIESLHYGLRASAITLNSEKTVSEAMNITNIEILEINE